MFIDKARITIKSGNGGNGIISFLRAKFIPKGGPDGGDGGRGGDVYIQGIRDINSLGKFKVQQHYEAQNGASGGPNNRHGKDGTDLVLHIPIGTQVWTEDKKFLIHDCTETSKILIAKGGRGGKGNARFKTSTNRTPYIREEGHHGYEMNIWLILKTIADVGIVGKPNSGKSSLLASISRAKPLIANYPFSTLHPNVGTVKIHNEYYSFADIPGLIEGAHLGKGLGHDFLQHIERCKVIIHMVDGSNNTVEHDIQIINHELHMYGIHKKSLIVINKIDLIEDLNKNPEYLYISTFTGEGLNTLMQKIIDIIRTNNLI